MFFLFELDDISSDLPRKKMHTYDYLNATIVIKYKGLLDNIHVVFIFSCVEITPAFNSEC